MGNREPPTGGRARAGLLAALRNEQARCGCLSREALLRIASEYGLSPSVVYGVATFYHEFVVGDGRALVVRVCDSPSCHLAGSENLIQQLRRLTARPRSAPPGGEADGALPIRIERVGCLGHCDQSPTMIMGDELVVRVRARELPLLLQHARGASGGGNGRADA